MQEMAPRFSKFFWGGGGGAYPWTPLANSLASLDRSLAALGHAPRIITLQSIFETWQACLVHLPTISKILIVPEQFVLHSSVLCLCGKDSSVL